MPRALLFDIGNVLLHFDFSTAAQRFADASDTSPAEVLSRLSEFKDSLESGRISDEDFITQSIARIGFRGTRGQFVEIWSDIFTENQPMTALVRRIAGAQPMYLFSNTSGLHHRWFFHRYDVFPLFSGGIYSHEVRCMKPHEDFYREAVRQFGVEPAQTLYIDDLAENIKTGARLGFVTHHYAAARHDALEEQVERWLGGV